MRLATRFRMCRDSLAGSLKSKRAGRTVQHKADLQVGVIDANLEACKLSLATNICEGNRCNRKQTTVPDELGRAAKLTAQAVEQPL